MKALQTIEILVSTVGRGIVGAVGGAVAGFLAGLIVAMFLAWMKASYLWVTLGPRVPGYFPFQWKLLLIGAGIGALIGGLTAVLKAVAHE